MFIDEKSDDLTAAAYKKRCSENSVFAHLAGSLDAAATGQDVAEARATLHRISICPRVMLANNGTPSTLHYNDMTLYHRPPEADLCQYFARVFEHVTGRPLHYDASSLPTFTAKAVAILCQPSETPMKSKDVVASPLAEQDRMFNVHV